MTEELSKALSDLATEPVEPNKVVVVKTQTPGLTTPGIPKAPWPNFENGTPLSDTSCVAFYIDGKTGEKIIHISSMVGDAVINIQEFILLANLFNCYDLNS